MEELLMQLSTDLQNLAIPKLYDWLILIVSGLSIFLSFIIFKRQTKLSKKQTEILEQQNKIALFEKRYKCYVSISVMEQILEYVCSYLEENQKYDRATRAYFVKNIKAVFETAGYDTSTDNRYKMAINTLSENVNCIGLLFDVDEPTEVNLHAYTKEFQKSLLRFVEEDVTYKNLNDIKNTISEYNSNFKDTIFEKQLKL